uniref:Uncharacterized protein n=1 Tax=Cannabis sativa TaxID=3483 RepID=A0A803NKU5_CANSA
MKAPTRRQSILTASPWLRTQKPYGTTPTDVSQCDPQSAPSAFNAATPVTAGLGGSYTQQNLQQMRVVLQPNTSLDFRRVATRMESSINDPTIILHDNEATFMSDMQIELVDLKRKRIENNSQSVINIRNSKEVNLEDEPNDFLNQDVVGLQKKAARWVLVPRLTN